MREAAAGIRKRFQVYQNTPPHAPPMFEWFSRTAEEGGTSGGGHPGLARMGQVAEKPFLKVSVDRLTGLTDRRKAATIACKYLAGWKQTRQG